MKEIWKYIKSCIVCKRKFGTDYGDGTRICHDCDGTLARKRGRKKK